MIDSYFTSVNSILPGLDFLVKGKNGYNHDERFLISFLNMIQAVSKVKGFGIKDNLDKVGLIGFFIPEIDNTQSKIFSCEKNGDIPKLYLWSMEKTIDIKDIQDEFFWAYALDFVHDYKSGEEMHVLIRYHVIRK